MAIKLHGSWMSTATLRVGATLYEKGLDFELVPPFGQVPAFEDGDLKLFESRAITKYIAYKYKEQGTELVGANFSEMPIIGVWMEVEAHHFAGPSTKLVWELCIKPMIGIPVDETVVEEATGKLNGVLDVYEARLAKNKYLGGDEFSLADLHHLPNIRYILMTPKASLFTSHPHVSRWWSDISSRPAWTKAAALSDAAIPKQA
ncbi:hypothetical protein AMTR_s00057p00211420 [Amborella trichopoda]|uniref:glutathione transferase n=1 Tax=Amborella trichopoda TaxID=13333 RepID=U5CUL2_AMBTC|nr:hypothetical protein AMTR_s00057p00211420 [Amborella trichopoda]